MAGPSRNLRKLLKSLEAHLHEENPVLVEAMAAYRKLSGIGYDMGLLSPNESYATQISWWPLVSVLGTFSAGKSTFINQQLGFPLQDTGNQAVDDKFTVICYSSEESGRVLPGLALNADPRFPFYQVSSELEAVAEGEGQRVDAYLQLKTCTSEAIRGRIMIDSPGFDADAQRTSTLQLTNHIIGLSDLVLVFFDARHPEPGAMSDTLSYLVRGTIDRYDSSKFLYILNQIDTTAREDNPEEVVGAWQRALAREGLISGRFYCIYDPKAAVPIEDPNLRRRFETKREQDMEEINRRIDQVSVERAYRVIGALEKHAQDIEGKYVPRLRELIGQWRNRVLAVEGALLGLLLLGAGGLGAAGVQAPAWLAPLGLRLIATQSRSIGLAVVAISLLVGLHYLIRQKVANWMVRRLQAQETPDEAKRLSRAFLRNTRFYRSIFSRIPVGWGVFNRKRLEQVLVDADHYVQSLNDRFTDPSGKKLEPPPKNTQYVFFAKPRNTAPPTPPPPAKPPVEEAAAAIAEGVPNPSGSA